MNLYFLHPVEKPMCFECDCGAKFIVGMWNTVPERDLLVIRYLNNHRQFYCCPFCAGKMSGKEMKVQP